MIRATQKILSGLKDVARDVVLAAYRAPENILFKTASRDWQICFGPVFGEAGTITTVTVPSQCLFRGEKLMAQDTGSPVGCGTRITQIIVGQRLQHPMPFGSILTAFLTSTALGNGVRWDTCRIGQDIALTVSFISSCTFDAVVFGKAVVL